MLASGPRVIAGVPQKRLVVFVRRTQSAPAKDFEASALPHLREVAKRRGVEVDVRDAAEGAPEEIHLTPLLVYQDAQGRSIFRGRYSEIDRVAQFLRTAEVAPLANELVYKDDTAVWRQGRAQVAAPLKITALTGAVPGDYDERQFLERARRAVASGFTRFRVEKRVALGPSDRSFYMDVHPYRDATGRLFLSAAIFSGFDCVTPVFQAFDAPVEGTWKAPDEAFARVGRLLEDRVAALVGGSSQGDGFDALPASNRAATWSQLGLALPAAAGTAQPAEHRAIVLPRRWVVEAASAEDPPRLAFRFAPPLDSYNGEVATITGEIELGDGGTLPGATGTIVARTGSVTMGNKVLDGEIKATILRSEAFPKATVVLDHVSGDDSPLATGTPAPFTATGHLEMLGASVPLTVQAQAEPFIAEDGSPRIAGHASFRLRIDEPFGLKGPEGAEPSRSTLLFDARLRLRPY